MPAISVIVPIFNGGYNLRQCIQSILKQSFRDFELILLNDGSTDNSLTVCQHYQSKDNRIKIINKPNEGLIRTRQVGIKASISPYIMFVDADDKVSPSILKQLFDRVIEDDLDITICDSYKFAGRFLSIKKRHPSPYFKSNKIYQSQEIKDHLIPAYFHGHAFPSNLWGKLYKRELLENSGEYIKRITFFGEDLFYNLEMFNKAKKVKVLNQALYYYRVGGSTDKYMPYLFDDMIAGFKIQKEFIESLYSESYDEHINGASIMLLNTFRTCLYNIVISPSSETEALQIIQNYCQNQTIIESSTNPGATQYFPKALLAAIRNNDANYLFDLGYLQYKNRRLKVKTLTLAKKLKLI